MNSDDLCPHTSACEWSLWAYVGSVALASWTYFPASITVNLLQWSLVASLLQQQITHSKVGLGPVSCWADLGGLWASGLV